MNFYRRRPFALVITAVLLCGIPLTVLSLTGKIIFILSAITVFSVAGVILSVKRDISVCGIAPKTFFTMVIALLIAEGILFCGFYDGYAGKYTGFCDGSIHGIRGVITGVEYESSYSSSYKIRLSLIDGEENHGSGLITVSGGVLSAGDEISASVTFTGTEDYLLKSRNELFSDGYVFVWEAESFEYLGEGGGIEAFIYNLRESTSALFSKYLDKDSAALCKALFCADKDSLGAIKRDFQRLGVSHLIALSGMHIAVLCAFIDFLLRKLGINRIVCLVIESVAVILYLPLTGFPYSALRAAVMFLIWKALFIFLGRNADSISILFVSFALIVLFCPPALLDAGLLLSFSATLGTLLFADAASRIFPPHNKKTAKMKAYNLFTKLFTSVSSAVGATLFVIPLLWAFFGSASLISIPATLILSVFCSLILALSLPYLLFAVSGLSILASRAGSLIILVTYALEKTASFLCGFAGNVSLRYPFALPVIIAAFAVIVIMMLKNVRNWFYSLLPAGIAIAVFFCSSAIYGFVASDSADVTFDSLKTDDVITVSSNGQGLVIDISKGSAKVFFSAKERLAQNYVTQTDALLLTHIHRSHITAFRQFSEKSVVEMLIIPVPDAANSDEAMLTQELCEAAESENLEVLYYERGADSIEFNGVSLGISKPSYLKRSVEPLVTVELSAILGDRSEKILYAGSSAWENSLPCDMDLIFLGSHGAKVKTFPECVSSPSYVFGGNPSLNRSISASILNSSAKNLRISLDGISRQH